MQCGNDDSDIYLNGDVLADKTKLYNLDRLSFGANHMFVVIMPDSEPR